MSLWSEPSEDNSVALTDAAQGPRLGFLAALEASFDAQRRADSTTGLSYFFEQLDAEQATRLRSMGLSANTLYDDPEADKISGFSEAPNTRYYHIAEAIVEGKNADALNILKRRDAELSELAKQHPEANIRTYTQMFDEVKAKAEQAERRANLPTTIGGSVGGFLGAAAGSLDPRTDPTNAATLAVGGFGKSAAKRIATEMGAQGAIETVNQLTGVSDNRRLMGLPENDKLSSIGMAAVGGGLFQGAGEAIGAGFRAGKARWFPDAPPTMPPPGPTVAPPGPSPVSPAPAAPGQAAGVVAPATRLRTGPAPQPPQVNLFERPDLFEQVVARERAPWGASRVAQARTIFDLDGVAADLDRWDGPRPWEADPPTATRLARDPQPVEAGIRAQQPGETVDEIARRIDPETFTIYDKLADRKARFQRWIDELKEPREKLALSKVEELDAEILRLKMRITTATKRNAKKYEARIAEIQPERDRLFNEMVSRETPDMARVRRDLVKVDEQMRDMAPVISRAYARARGKWDAYEQQRADIAKMIATGRKETTPTLMVDDVADDVLPAPKSLAEKVPLLATRPDIVDALPTNADAADAVKAIIDENAKIFDEALETRRAAVQKLVRDRAKAKETPDPNMTPEERAQLDEILIDGFDTPIKLNEKIPVPNEDGAGFREITVREMLEELDDDEAILKAVTSCSVR
jgi:hypothetical protein